MKKTDLLSLYVSPTGITSAPDYVKRLAEQAGVTQLVIRTGFHASEFDENLYRAVEIVKQNNLDVCLLVGTWWGHAVQEPDTRYGNANESRFPATMPGSKTDAEIAEKLEKLCTRLEPNAICLTHSRYRHPAYINGIFDLGDEQYQSRLETWGIQPSALREVFKSLPTIISRMAPKKLCDISFGGLTEFLCEAAGTNLFHDFFLFRNQTIASSVNQLKETVNAYSGIRFGSNIYSPIASDLCGQNYELLGGIYDFIQPLLGYVEWHVLECILAWARYLLSCNKNLSERDAIFAAKRLFFLEEASLPETIVEGAHIGEGPDDLVRAVVSKEVSLLTQRQRIACEIQPVLRGKDWSHSVTMELMDRIKAAQFDGIVFQGSDYLCSPSPINGWN